MLTKFLKVMLCAVFLTVLTAQESLNCTDTPFTRLSTCNSTCNSCLTGYDQCQSCPMDLSLDRTLAQCRSPMDFQTFYYAQLFNLTFDFTNSTKSGFRVNSQPLIGSSGQIFHEVQVCGDRSYRFDILGMFAQSDVVLFNHLFQHPVAQLQIRFRMISLIDNVTVTIFINNNQFYQTTILSANLVHNYTNITGANPILQIGSLSRSTADSLLPIIQTGSITFDSDLVDLTIEVHVNGNRTRGIQFWGIFQYVMIGKVCQTCINQQLRGLSVGLGIALGITAGFLCVLVIALCIFVKYKDLSRFQAKEYGQKETLYRNKFVERAFTKVDYQKVRSSIRRSVI